MLAAARVAWQDCGGTHPNVSTEGPGIALPGQEEAQASMRFLQGAEIEGLVNAAELIDVVLAGLRAVRQGAAIVPERLVLELPEHRGTLFVMPAYLPELPSLTVKTVTVHAGNRERGLPTTQGQILLLDETTGSALAAMDGAMVTRLRTGAVTALATSLLAPRDPSVLGILGTGAQAAGIAEGILGLRGFSIREVRVHSRSPQNRARFIRDLERRLADLGWPVPEWQDTDSAEAAVRGAQVVVCATTASEPLFRPEAIEGPCHVNAVGVFRPEAAEIPAEVVGRASMVVVESQAAARREGGDLVRAARAGMLEWDAVTELVDVAEHVARPRGADEVTLFKSVGVAVLDAAVARYIFQRL